MTRTSRKFTFACALVLGHLSAISVAFAESEEFSLQPHTLCDRYAPDYCYGPVQLSFDYSSSFGLVIDPKYINNIGPWDALSLEFAFGAKEFRGGFTWGHVITEQNFIKFSAEYFAQEPDFRFKSGEDGEWIGQKGYGIEYSFRPKNSPSFQDAHINLTWTSAASETMKPLPFNGQTDFRRAEGGINYGVSLGVSVRPWTGALITLNAHHDSVKYNGKYSNIPSLVGIGASMMYQQIVGDRFNITLEGMDRQAYFKYAATFNSLLNSAPGSRLEIFARYTLTGGSGVVEEQENRFGIGILYSWGGNKYGPLSNYNSPLRPSITQQLIDYSNNPAVRPAQVIAKRDEKLV